MLLVACGLTMLVAAPATAGTTMTTIARSTWAHTDSRSPGTSFAERPHLGEPADGARQTARYPRLSARLTDPNPTDRLSGTFALWPVDQPDQRTELTTTSLPNGLVASVNVPDSLLTDGRTYAWVAHADDGDDVSNWSTPCQYTVDFTNPGVPPTVSSMDYPDEGTWSGGPGVPGSFTFAANGVADRAGNWSPLQEYRFFVQAAP